MTTNQSHALSQGTRANQQPKQGHHANDQQRRKITHDKAAGQPRQHVWSTKGRIEQAAMTRLKGKAWDGNPTKTNIGDLHNTPHHGGRGAHHNPYKSSLFVLTNTPLSPLTSIRYILLLLFHYFAPCHRLPTSPPNLLSLFSPHPTGLPLFYIPLYIPFGSRKSLPFFLQCPTPVACGKCTAYTSHELTPLGSLQLAETG